MTKRQIIILMTVVLLSAWPFTPLYAVQPDEMLTNPQLETRARNIEQELRCLVCQNQSIDDSDADLAHDLRLVVRQRLTAGDTDEAVKQYIVARYGEYVLLNPPFISRTLVLWIGPGLFLLLAMFLWFGSIKKENETLDQSLSAEEQAELKKLLDFPRKNEEESP